MKTRGRVGTVDSALSAKYEHLRERMLGGSQSGGVGLAVLQSQGMWAWIELMRCDAVEPPTELLPTESARTASTVGPGNVPPRFVSVWADMIEQLVSREPQ